MRASLRFKFTMIIFSLNYNFVVRILLLERFTRISTRVEKDQIINSNLNEARLSHDMFAVSLIALLLHNLQFGRFWRCFRFSAQKYDPVLFTQGE